MPTVGQVRQQYPDERKERERSAIDFRSSPNSEHLLPAVPVQHDTRQQWRLPRSCRILVYLKMHLSATSATTLSGNFWSLKSIDVSRVNNENCGTSAPRRAATKNCTSG